MNWLRSMKNNVPAFDINTDGVVSSRLQVFDLKICFISGHIFPFHGHLSGAERKGNYFYISKKLHEFVNVSPLMYECARF